MNTELITQNNKIVTILEEIHKLEDHIDEPIKKCVIGLALLDLNPIFSCCAFSYKNEKVVKSHLTNPYIYLDYGKMNLQHKNILLYLAQNSGWMINFLPQNMVDFKGMGFPQGHPWADPNSPHCYENAVLAINRLENVINTCKQSFKDSATLIDGNRIYTEICKVKYWQYPICEDWVVTKELYDSL